MIQNGFTFERDASVVRGETQGRNCE